jgi:coproporphyrinogen III oxidase-like Fe-S oxidoreductase
MSTLMYALPGQTLQGLAQELDRLEALAPPHLSLYQLTLEPNTAFARRPPELPDVDLASEMLDLLGARAAAGGWQRYEVSAYARTGHRCRHNLNYWEFGDYLGIGAGAHSKLSFPHRGAAPGALARAASIPAAGHGRQRGQQPA